MDSTESSLERLRAGDLSGLEYLFQRYRNRLLAWARYRLSREFIPRLDEEDLFQEVSVVICRKVTDATFKSGDDFFHWCIAILDNRLKDLRKRHLESEKRTVIREDHGIGSSTDNLPFALPEEETPSGILQARARLHELLDVVEQLPPLQRDAIFHVRVAGLPVAEAARRLSESGEDISIALVRGFMNVRKLVRLHPDRWPHLAEEDPDQASDVTGLCL
jgi:RNA polymerase sigma factor (sigma-70 family)